MAKLKHRALVPLAPKKPLLPKHKHHIAPKIPEKQKPSTDGTKPLPKKIKKEKADGKTVAPVKGKARNDRHHADPKAGAKPGEAPRAAPVGQREQDRRDDAAPVRSAGGHGVQVPALPAPARKRGPVPDAPAPAPRKQRDVGAVAPARAEATRGKGGVIYPVVFLPTTDVGEDGLRHLIEVAS